MTNFILIVGLILLAVSVAVLVQAVVAPRRSGQAVDQIGAYGFRGFVSRDDVADSGGRTSLGDDGVLVEAGAP